MLVHGIVQWSLRQGLCKRRAAPARCTWADSTRGRGTSSTAAPNDDGVRDEWLKHSGVQGDHVPDRFVKQFAFPFSWKA